MGAFYFFWMLLLPSIREPRLLTTPLWIVLNVVGGVVFGVAMTLYVRHRHPPPPARPDEHG